MEIDEHLKYTLWVMHPFFRLIRLADMPQLAIRSLSKSWRTNGFEAYSGLLPINDRLSGWYSSGTLLYEEHYLPGINARRSCPMDSDKCIVLHGDVYPWGYG